MPKWLRRFRRSNNANKVKKNEYSIRKRKKYKKLSVIEGYPINMEIYSDYLYSSHKWRLINMPNLEQNDENKIIISNNEDKIDIENIL